MTEDERKKVRMVNGCALLLGELTVCTALGGVFGWPVGAGTFGVMLIAHTIWVRIQLRKTP